MAVQFLTFDQAQMQPFRAEYRYSLATSLAALITLLTVTLGCLVLAAMAWNAGKWLGVLFMGWCTFWFGLMALFANMVLRARRLPTNWLVRMKQDGLLIKYRSYLNHHFPAENMTVVYLRFSDIEWVRKHRIRRNMPGAARADDSQYRYRYIELKLRGELVEEIGKRVDEERRRVAPAGPRWMGNARSTSRHYPVQTVQGGLLRLEWGVRPKVQEFLREIGSFVAVKPALGSDIDFRQIEQMGKAEQEQHLLELIETGDRINAIKAVKLLYKLSTTEAVRFIDEFKERGAKS